MSRSHLSWSGRGGVTINTVWVLPPPRLRDSGCFAASSLSRSHPSSERRGKRPIQFSFIPCIDRAYSCISSCIGNLRETTLQNAEEIDEVLFLFVGEPDLEAAIEEVHQCGQIAGGTVREVG